MSPRTRNVPRVNSWSLRSYWISTSLRRISSRSMRLAPLERHQQAVVRLRRSEAVDARHAGDDDDVAALEERAGRRQPQPIDLLVDDRFLLDVRVGGRHVGFRLVVVVVADEELDGVVREEAPELLVELRRQRLVVDHHERRPVHARPATCAIVNVLPEPVTPSSTWALSPRRRPSTSWSIACGWSPRSSKSVSS